MNDYGLKIAHFCFLSENGDASASEVNLNMESVSSICFLLFAFVLGACSSFSFSRHCISQNVGSKVFPICKQSPYYLSSTNRRTTSKSFQRMFVKNKRNPVPLQTRYLANDTVTIPRTLQFAKYFEVKTHCVRQCRNQIAKILRAVAIISFWSCFLFFFFSFSNTKRTGQV